MTEQIIYQIPGYENGLVHYVSTNDEVSAIFLASQIVSDLLNKWNTNVAGSEFERSAQIRLFFTFIVQIQNCICELRF